MRPTSSPPALFVPAPLSLRWDPAAPLPTRLILPLKRTTLPAVLAAPTWIPTGPWDQSFDFSGHLRRLIDDIVRRCSEFNHIDANRLLIGGLQARHAKPHGLQARVTPLRFRRGALTRPRRNVLYQVQRYFHGECEFLYLVTFCLPRFLDQDFDAKFITIFHELYHIGPLFDGDLRRHQGRCHLHTHSQKQYDRGMAKLAREYLATKPDPALFDFLRLNFAQLYQRHGGVEAVAVPRPKIVPLLHAAQLT
ncbi:MAG: hypothetical protein U0793_01780 [Gemmataceae bacterium]